MAKVSPMDLMEIPRSIISIGMTMYATPQIKEFKACIKEALRNPNLSFCLKNIIVGMKLILSKN